jgi:hypothetical protein
MVAILRLLSIYCSTVRKEIRLSWAELEHKKSRRQHQGFMSAESVYVYDLEEEEEEEDERAILWTLAPIAFASCM